MFYLARNRVLLNDDYSGLPPAYKNSYCRLLRLRAAFLVRVSPYNPYHPDTSMHIFHTILYTLPKVLIKIICLVMKRFLPW